MDANKSFSHPDYLTGAKVSVNPLGNFLPAILLKVQICP